LSKTVQQLRLDAEVSELSELIRRVVAARLRDQDTIEEVVQETLTRVLEVGPRLDDEALAPYAITTARNLIASLGRRAERHKRNMHRIIDLRETPRPEDEVVRREERQAVATALSRLPQRDRDAVVAHEVQGVDTATLAREQDTTPGGVAMRLARARARLRVEYLIILYGEPPSTRCRPILVALSAGDNRRQQSLGAGPHLMDCAYCGALGGALMERRRSLTALLPLSAFGRVMEFPRRVWKHPATKVAGATALVLGVTAAAATLVSNPPIPQDREEPERISQERSVGCPRSQRVLLSGGRMLPSVGARRLSLLEGESVEACSMRISATPADEGFWIGDGPARIWVELKISGESPRHFKPGQSLNFTAKVVAHPQSFTRRLTREEGARLLRRQGHHLVVAPADIRISSAP
jgi:RNA polymerase sigma factor (sigma-70 family)